MAPAKRARESRQPSSKPRKRAKVNKTSQTPNPALEENAITRADVVPDKLSWKKVALPDRLDDAEGFFDLEEVDGVDVVRNEQSGEVAFEYVDAQSRKHRKNGVSSSRNQTENVETAAGSSIEAGDEEWQGIEDGDASQPAQLPSNVTPIDKKKARKGRNNRKNAAKRAKQQRDAKLRSLATQGNEFAGLEDEPSGEDTDVSAWSSLDLSAETLISLAKLGFSRPTPIQSAAIPEICANHDVIGKAVTGSGKTLAFGIPILEHHLVSTGQACPRPDGIEGGRRKPPLALIISPTRELAHQLSKHLGALFSNIPSRGPDIATLTGGLSLQKQRRLLACADVVVATPGRLWEVVNEGAGLLAWLKRSRYLVVDEADRLLSEGHFKEFEEFLRVLDQEDDHDDEARDGSAGDDEPGKSATASRQTLVFSATFHKGLQRKLAGARKFDAANVMDARQSIEYVLQRLNFREEAPKYVDVNPVSQMAARLKEGLVECAALEKDLYLYALLLYTTGKRTLIFTNSISSVRRVTSMLQMLDLGAQALHSQMIQKARLRSIERFASLDRKHSILVATDVAARGLDIPHVDLVLHYHVPRTADMYIHRSGRTARAEEAGSSILLCSPDEVVGVRRLVAKVHATSDAHRSKVNAYIRSLDLDRKVVARLKPRSALAKRIVDSMLAKEKRGAEDEWLRTAADQLGVDYDSEEFEAAGSSGRRRGRGREKAEREARNVSKDDLARLRRELKELLGDRINVGVSEKYLTRGGVDVGELLDSRDTGKFLGQIDAIDFED